MDSLCPHPDRISYLTIYPFDQISPTDYYPYLDHYPRYLFQTSGGWKIRKERQKWIISLFRDRGVDTRTL